MDGNQIDKIKSFFYGQYFEAGLRITFGIILPALLLSFQGNITIGITLSLGALCVAITDIPGPFYHKRNGMLFTLLFISTAALLTGMLSSYPILLSIEIPLLCFFFAMLNIYGARASLSGTAALLIMMISTDQNHLLNGYLMHSLFVLLGGGWYMLLSLVVTKIRPYRLAQQALGECVLAISAYLKIRSRFYDDKTPIEENYKNLIIHQIEVNHQLDAVREIILKSRRMVNEPAGSGKLLILTFADIVDLFEFATATPYDYAQMREKYSSHHTLPEISKIIIKISQELDNIGYSLINNEIPRSKLKVLKEIEQLKTKIDDLGGTGESVFVLKKVLINLLNLNGRLDTIFNYFQKGNNQLSESKPIELDKFVSHQKFSWKLFVDNLNFNSVTFRHSIRLAIACFIGYLVSHWFSFGEHSYWLLVTILVILKPDYSLTKERNNQRIIGTGVGGITGILILYVIENEVIRFIILLVFMVLAFTFNRTKYVLSVLFLTPFILILFSFVTVSDNIDLVQERVINTLLGSFIALFANYFIFPNWESRQRSPYLLTILKANLYYFLQILSKFEPAKFSNTTYKLSRKDVYVQTSNLGAAFQRMLNEPKHKQKNMSMLYQFLVLNNILSSYLSTLSLTIDENKNDLVDQDIIKAIRKIFINMVNAINNVDSTALEHKPELPNFAFHSSHERNNDSLIKEQLTLIQKIAMDLEKLTKAMNPVI